MHSLSIGTNFIHELHKDFKGTQLFQLQHGENKWHFDEMMIVMYKVSWIVMWLCTRPTSWVGLWCGYVLDQQADLDCDVAMC